MSETSPPPDETPPAVDDPGAPAERAPEPLAFNPAWFERPAPPPPPAHEVAPPARRHLREYVEMLLVAILIVLFVATFVARNSVIPTPSMERTLLVGDYLFVDRIVFAPVDDGASTRWLAQRPLRHGDVVVFKYPKDATIDYIKRVIGLPGDMVEVKDRQLIRNGEAIDEPYKVHATARVPAKKKGRLSDGHDDYGPVRVPDGHLFVMGDNRDHSADSREWSFVPTSHVTGRAFLVFWSRAPRMQEPGVGGRTWFSRGLEWLANFNDDMRWSRIGTVVK